MLLSSLSEEERTNKYVNKLEDRRCPSLRFPADLPGILPAPPAPLPRELPAHQTQRSGLPRVRSAWFWARASPSSVHCFHTGCLQDLPQPTCGRRPPLASIEPQEPLVLIPLYSHTFRIDASFHTQKSGSRCPSPSTSSCRAREHCPARPRFPLLTSAPVNPIPIGCRYCIYRRNRRAHVPRLPPPRSRSLAPHRTFGLSCLAVYGMRARCSCGDRGAREDRDGASHPLHEENDSLRRGLRGQSWPDRRPQRLGPPPPRPRRSHLHRPPRPRRPDSGRLRPFPGA